MRLIVILLALAVVGLLAAKQLQRPPLEPSRVGLEGGMPGVPVVPQRPQDLQRFEQDMNRFVDETARERQRQIDEATAR